MKPVHKTARPHKSLASTHHLPKRLRKKNSKLRFARRQVLSPISPPQSPPRLRRLGVRQAGEDRSFTFTSETEDHDTKHEQMLKDTHSNAYQTEDVASNMFIQRRIGDKKSKSSTTSINPLGRTTVLKCPVCTKHFLSFYGHDVHLDIHDSAAIRCWPCNIRFSSNKSLLQHQRLRHNKRKEEERLGGKGFHNLIFADFSCDKFAAVCQRFCEMYTVEAACSLHEYPCSQCHKSFPMQAALDLHIAQYHYYPSKFICTLCHHDYRSKAKLDEHKLNYPVSTKRQLADSKRKFLRALSLMPQCAAENMLRHKQPPEVNMDYYEKLKGVPSVTKLVYALTESRSEDEEDSDSSQS